MSASRGETMRAVKMAIVVLIVSLVAAGCELADWEVGGQYRPYYCDPTDTAINDGHGASHGGHQDYTEEKGPLSAVDCLALQRHLNRAVAHALEFPTKADAEAAGWHWLAPFISGQGTHHVDYTEGVTSEFNPDRPNMLMYDSNNGSGELTGMVWAVVSHHGPPEGFPGDNDHWHYHETLCYQNGPDPFIIGDSISDAQCEARGGTNQDASDTWLLHVWLPEYEGEQMDDVFNKSNPRI